MTGILVGAAVSIVVAMLAAPLLARALKARGIGQPIHEAVTQHAHKVGTPTMGGAVITFAAVIAYGAARLSLWSPPSMDGLKVLGITIAAAVIGGIDDWRKVGSRRNSGGLSRKGKSALQLPIIAVFCWAHIDAGSCTTISVTRCDAGIDVGPLGWMVFAIAFVWATSNAVNFSDGLEGLLAGSGSVTFLTLFGIAFWQFRHLGDYGVEHALDLAIIASCLAAACVGFLWWNVTPMTLFMGDVGSLAIGTGVAALALTMNVSLLVLVFGAYYVMQGASVALQISTWKLYFKRRGGTRRLFRMAPLHHHYEVVGWSESTILVRFWILNGIAASLGLAIFYLDALTLL